MTIEYYLMGITFVASLVVIGITAGPGSRLPLFPDRIFFYSLAVSLLGATLWYFIRAADPSDTGAKVYSQWLNATARTGVAISGMVLLYRWAAKCRRIKHRRALSHD